jgi:hypothetical protein
MGSIFCTVEMQMFGYGHGGLSLSQLNCMEAAYLFEPPACDPHQSIPPQYPPNDLPEIPEMQFEPMPPKLVGLLLVALHFWVPLVGTSTTNMGNGWLV